MKSKFPKISIVTPSYSQGAFIERTIKSVLSQNYPNLEYIVMDGGSTDKTVKILKKYGKQITWKSERDRGQTHAINKGLKLATGEIVTYLNSDDTYQPGTLKLIGEYFRKHPKVAFAYGHGRLIDPKDKEIGFYNDFQEDHEKLFASCGISQPTAFWRRKLLKTVGLFDETFHFTMDYEYWVRVSAKYELVFLPNVLANTRIHPDAKTSAFTHKLHTEAIRVDLTHYGKVHYDWIFTYVDSGYGGKKDSAAYFRHMVAKSLIYYLWYNHSFPSGKGLKVILSWTKHLISVTKTYL